MIDFATVFRSAGAGDPLAGRVRDRCVKYWSALAVSLVHAYDPDRIVIGGAVARSADVFLPVMREHVRRHAWTTAPVELHAARLGNDAAFYGAAAMFGGTLDYI